MDRNDKFQVAVHFDTLSLSARRAWIEIEEQTEQESTVEESLSARRAWIEILHDVSLNYKEVVALRKESVDRNAISGAQKSA